MHRSIEEESNHSLVVPAADDLVSLCRAVELEGGAMCPKVLGVTGEGSARGRLEVEFWHRPTDLTHLRCVARGW